MKQENQTRTRGFTLIEIMMAMAIFTLVLTAIYATWTAILKGSKVGLEAAAQAQRERMAIHLIEEALMASRSFAGDLQHYGFVAENGSEATLSFVAKLPKSYPRSGRFGDLDVRRVVFSVENGAGSQRQLVLRQSPILMEFDQDEKEHPLVVARNVKELLLEFSDPRTGEWMDTWKQTNQLPKLVKVTLRMTPLNQRNAYAYSAATEEITRVVALPSIAVPAAWQKPNLGGAPPGQGVNLPRIPTPPK